MPDTYSQLNIHGVFAVKRRENIITKNFRDPLHKYMSGILNEYDAFPLAVGGWLDHVHVFFELKPSQRISDVIGHLKAVSSKWINENHFVKGKFNWQEGYGAFSYSKSQRDRVIKYIMKQEEHHRKMTFREEYIALLKKFGAKYKEEYLFEFYDLK